MKQYQEIEWDEHNIYKNAEKHGVQYWEIEETFENIYIILKNKKIKETEKGEKRKILLGQTSGGRYLFVVFEDKGNGLARPISARNMEEDERKFYEQKIKRQGI